MTVSRPFGSIRATLIWVRWYGGVHLPHHAPQDRGPKRLGANASSTPAGRDALTGSERLPFLVTPTAPQGSERADADVSPLPDR